MVCRAAAPHVCNSNCMLVCFILMQPKIMKIVYLIMAFQVSTILLTLGIAVFNFRMRSTDWALPPIFSGVVSPDNGFRLVSYHHSINLALWEDTNSQTHVRAKEEIYAMRRNLQHPLVVSMHIIAANEKRMEEFLKKEEIQDQNIIIYNNRRPPTMKEIFQYINDNFVNKTVIFSNGDIYIGSGFDKLNHTAMLEQRIMYALTRQHAPEGNCSESQAVCAAPYIASHDTFVLHLSAPIPGNVLNELDYQLGSWGAENKLMWAFQTKLNFCVLNPCSILETYHYHCSNIRYRRTRINKNKKVLCPPTLKLTCNQNV